MWRKRLSHSAEIRADLPSGADFSNFVANKLLGHPNKGKKNFEEGSPFNADDWQSSEALSAGKLEGGPNRLTLVSGATGKYYTKDDHGGGETTARARAYG